MRLWTQPHAGLCYVNQQQSFNRRSRSFFRDRRSPISQKIAGRLRSRNLTIAIAKTRIFKRSLSNQQSLAVKKINEIMRYSSKQKTEILFTSWWSPKLQSHIFRFWPRACCTKAVLRMHLLLLVLLTYNITKNLVFLKIIPDFSQWVSWSPYHFPIFVQEREIVTSFQKFVRSFCTQVYLRKNMLLSELCMDDWNPIFWDNEFFTSI